MSEEIQNSQLKINMHPVLSLLVKNIQKPTHREYSDHNSI